VVAAYNAEFLFLDRSNCPGSGCPWSDPADAELHFKDIATELSRLNADIISLEEVQDCTALKTLISYMPEDSGYVPYLVKGTDTSTGQNVGLLTRIDPSMDLTRTEDRANYPIKGSACYGNSSVQPKLETESTGISKHYYTIINVNGVRILFLGLHLVAFPVMPDRCAQREGQATVAQRIIEAMQGKFDEVVILGDFNDYSATVVDTAGDLPTSKVLAMLTEPVDSLVLSEAAAPLPQSQRYSAWYDIDDSCYDEGGKENTMIDHLLFSSGFEVLSTAIAHNYEASCKGFYSDHWPVVAVFNTPL